LGTPSSGTLTNATGLPLTTGVTGLLPIANGGTGTATPALVAGTNVTITGSWPNQTINSTASGSGTVTSVAATVPTFLSVAGSPITSSGTLAISLSGTALPVLNGGTGVTTSTGSGNNVLSTSPTLVTPILGTPTSATLTNATGLPLSTGVTGTLPIANGGTGATTLAGANIAVVNVANTFTATQTFSGSSSVFGTSLLDSNETVNVVAAAPSATTNFYVQSGSVQYYTTSAANNWTLNIAFSSGTSMNTALAVGQSVTFTLVTTQGATAYYNSAVTIDGTSVTPKWVGGAPTAGNASGLDVYRYAVIKTASATYTVLASLTQFK
jgi:hypothetical protein